MSRTYPYAHWQPAFVIHGLARLAAKIHGLQIVRRQLLAPDGNSALAEMTVAALLDLIEYGLAANSSSLGDPLVRYVLKNLGATIDWSKIPSIDFVVLENRNFILIEGKADADVLARFAAA